MTRRRYVVRFRGQGEPGGDVEEIRCLAGLRVLEESSRMLLVEGEDEVILALGERLSGWVVAPERTYPVPDTRKRLR
jgi:hypothetical protein